MPESVKCNFCGSAGRYVMFRYGGLCIVRCADCGLVYTSPRLTEKESRAVYRDFNAAYDERTMKAWTDTAKRRLAELMKFKKSGSLLELGCSIGYFLNEARKRGFDCYGIETSAKAAAAAKKLYGLRNVSTGARYMGMKKRFDAVAAYHVLEHMPDPMETMRKLSSAMKDDGVMVVEVPDAGSLKPKFLKSKWVAYDVYRHLYYFDSRSLSRIMSAAGLRIAKKVSIPNMLLSELGPKQEAAIRSLPPGARNILSMASLYASFIMRKAGVGDAIRVYAVKK